MDIDKFSGIKEVACEPLNNTVLPVMGHWTNYQVLIYLGVSFLLSFI